FHSGVHAIGQPGVRVDLTHDLLIAELAEVPLPVFFATPNLRVTYGRCAVPSIDCIRGERRGELIPTPVNVRPLLISQRSDAVHVPVVDVGATREDVAVASLI